jgi:hypothetical protein
VFEWGKVLYYDPKEGLYYDRDSDIYVSNEEMELHHKLVREDLNEDQSNYGVGA